MKIKQQDSFILIGTLKICVLGKDIRIAHDVKIARGHYDTQIEFTRKACESAGLLYARLLYWTRL